VREGNQVRKLGSLTAALLGVAAVFSSLTLVAVSRPGLAGCFAIGGLVLVVVGLRCLSGDPTPG